MKTDNIKRIISYVFTSTGAVMFFLAVFLMFKENRSISAGTILEIIGANTVITIGLFLTFKIELRFLILEFLLDIVFMIAVIVLSGTLFGWYSYIPVWVPVIMVIVVYILFYLLDIIRVRKEIKEINKLLGKLKEKEGKNASW
jgi:Ca2+/Na+ antiporter